MVRGEGALCLWDNYSTIPKHTQLYVCVSVCMCLWMLLDERKTQTIIWSNKQYSLNIQICVHRFSVKAQTNETNCKESHTSQRPSEKETDAIPFRSFLTRLYFRCVYDEKFVNWQRIHCVCVRLGSLHQVLIFEITTKHPKPSFGITNSAIKWRQTFDKQ